MCTPVGMERAAVTPAPLSRAALPLLSAAVSVPRYDPAKVRAGIVHLGLGGFHRAHMARYTHDLMQLEPAALSWGIVGAGLMAGDRKMAQSLAHRGARRPVLGLTPDLPLFATRSPTMPIDICRWTAAKSTQEKKPPWLP